MQRKILALCFAIAMVAPASVWALGLGKATVNSSLNQPLSAEIPILSARPRDLDNMTAKLAPSEMFDRAKIKRSLFLSQLKFEIDKESTPPKVKISSRSNITDPFVTLILELNWANGRIMREFTLMLDPPRGVPMPRMRERPARQRPATGRIAQRPQEQPSEFKARPTATTGSRLGTDYGRVRPGQTLWQIATEVKGKETMTTEQLVMALYRTNPQAFSQENINTLLAGRRLRVPTAEEVREVPAQRASAEFREQVRAWRRGLAAADISAEPAQREAAGVARAGEREPADLAKTDPARPAAARKPADRADATQIGPRLQVLAATDVDESELSQDVETLQSALVQARDDSQRFQREREEQASRMQAMQERLNLLERLVTLKDRELAALQQQSAKSLGMVLPKEEEHLTDAARREADDGSLDTAAAKRAEKEERTEEVELVSPSQVISPRVIDDEESSKIDFIWNRPKAWLIAAGVMLAVLSIIWIFIRSLTGREDEDDADLAAKLERLSIQAAEAERLAAESIARKVEDFPEQGGVGQSVNPFSQDQSAPILSTGASQLSEATTGSFSSELSETEMDEVLKEVKIFLNYGRPDHAINFLVKLIDSYPDEVKPRLALLRLCSEMKREDLFAEQAQALWDQLEDKTSEEWLEVAAMGKRLLPDHPLFGPASLYDSSEAATAGADNQEILTFNLPSDEREEDLPSSTQSESIFLGDSDHEFDDAGFEFSAETPKEESLKGGGLGLGLGELTEEFSLGDASSDQQSDEGLTFDGEFSLDSDASAESMPPLEFESSKESESVTQSDESDAEDESQEDLIENRLELAKTYVEMGDIDNAIDIIKEVIKNGNPTQVDEASRLLLSLDLT